MPVLGNLLQCQEAEEQAKREGTNYHLTKYILDKNYKDYCGVALAFITNQAYLNIHDPKIVEVMYTSKNKFFDKHPLVKDLCHVFTGESILFAETTDNWRLSRKAISPAFYKGKLV